MLPCLVNSALHHRLRSFPLTQLRAIPVSDSSAHSASPRWILLSPLFLATLESPLSHLESTLVEEYQNKQLQLPCNHILTKNIGGRGLHPSSQKSLVSPFRAPTPLLVRRARDLSSH